VVIFGQPNKDSITSEENLLEDVEERVMARTRSQAALMANKHDEIIDENAKLATALEHARAETRDIREELSKALSGL
jgi:hypothetical protein